MARVCFCKANILFAEEFINLSGFILKPLCALSASLASKPRVLLLFSAPLKINSRRVKGGGVIVVTLAISLSDVINCAAAGLDLSRWPAGCAPRVDDESGRRLQRWQAARHPTLQMERPSCQRGEREGKRSVFENGSRLSGQCFVLLEVQRH